MVTLKVELSKEEFRGLARLADRDIRTLGDEGRYIIRQCLVMMGLMADPNETMPRVSLATDSEQSP